MCRMLIAFGHIDMNSIIDGMILMSKDEITTHEFNKGKGNYKHKEGWGIAYLQNNVWKIEKSTKAFFEDPNIDKLRRIKSDMVILHVRKKTNGILSYENTHPFLTSTSDNKQILFFHNGTIKDYIKFNEKFKVVGDTDSERLLYSILTDLKQNNEKSEEIIIKEHLKKYKQCSGTNIILASRTKSIVAIKYNQHPKYYSMRFGTNKDMKIISSEILPNIKDTNWVTLKNNQVITINNFKKNYKII